MYSLHEGPLPCTARIVDTFQQSSTCNYSASLCSLIHAAPVA